MSDFIERAREVMDDDREILDALHEHDSDLPRECEECGKNVGLIQAEDSYHATVGIGRRGRVLCGKHLDRHQRQTER